ncbi:MAG: alpha/beta hydrolase-fold protein [Planctomycetota bacterium]|nr:alpha/beta hydrolase-fold protein [Planctomycetota bacterium]
MVRSLQRLAALFTLTLACTAPAHAKESPLEAAVRKESAKIATVWIKLAGDLVKADIKTEALAALERAKALAPDDEALGPLATTIDALAGAGEATDATRKRIESANGDAAKGHDKLAKAHAKYGDEAGALRETLTALELDPSKSRLQAIAAPAMKSPLLLRSPTHEAAAYVSLPSGWKPGKTYPVLVSVDGAGANFLGNANAFKGGRGSRAFITVAPHALSCTNAIEPAKFPAYSQALIDKWNGNRVAFDVPGLLAMLDFLRAHFGAEEKVAITGFSGGGNLCYGFLLAHPERVLCAAPACANFQPGLAQGAQKPAEGGPPVHVMTGEKDPHRDLTHGKTPPGIEQQTDWAMKAFEENGFTNVKRTMLPGVGHSNLVKEVWAFVDETYGK